MKKIICMVLALMLTISLAAGMIGCGGKQLDETEDPINVNLPTDYKGSLTIATNTAFYNDIEKVKVEFNKKYPNITVTVKPQPDQNKSILQWYNGDRVKPGTSPDLFWFTTLDWLPLAEGGILKDLSAAMDAADEAGTLDVSDMKEDIMVLGRKGFTKQGSQYMFPTTYDQFVTYINTEIFKHAGIEIGNRGTDEMTFTYTPLGDSAPKTIKAQEWTWEQFEEIALLIKEYYTDNQLFNGVAPVTAHLESEALISGVLGSFDVDILGDNGEILIEEGEEREALIEGLDFMHDMVEKGYTAYVAPGAMGQGTIAMHFQSRAGMIVPEEPTEGVEYPDSGYFCDDMLDVVPFPAIGDNPKFGGGSHGYAMYRYTRHQDEAWAFLQFMLSQEGQDVLGDSGLQVPILKSMDEPKTDGENWNWLSKPTAQMNHAAFISYPERMYPTIFQMVLPTEIQTNVFKAYVAMAQTTTQSNGSESAYNSAIDSFINLIEAEKQKV